MEKKRKAARADARFMGIATVVLLLMVICGVAIYVYKYAPTSAHMSAEDYFGISGDEAAVMVDGQLVKKEDGSSAPGLIRDGESYVRLDILKDYVDDGYVYDDSEHILRYATDKEVITAALDESKYSMGRESVELSAPAVIEEDAAYISAGFFSVFSQAVYEKFDDPGRIVIVNDKYKPEYMAITKDTAVRRLGGPKSKVIKDGAKGDVVMSIESYGKWTQVATVDGFLGCVRSDRLKETEVDRKTSDVPDREYSHISVDHSINMLWHQVHNTTANRSVGQVIAKSNDINVLSPTWFRVSDNSGSLNDVASMDYVNTCHASGIQVWALVSNFEVEGVDTASVLNRTSARDNLVNNIIAKAIAYNLDGINIDFELVPESAKDGYIQFIRELSIKCENNDIILSVDNYVPASYNKYYNRKVQADYADYIVIMAYDEHYTGSTEAGSNSSLPYVKDAVEATLKDVPAEQFILGLPFYAREFVTSDSGVTNTPIGMNKIDEFLRDYDLTKTWLEKEQQNYAEYTDEVGDLHQLWIEDSKSLARKLTLIKDNDLAGGAFWKSGFEDATIWDVIAGYIN